MKDKINKLILDALVQLDIQISPGEIKKLKIDYPDPKFGDYSSNAALILSKKAGQTPMELAQAIAEKIDQEIFEKIEVVKPGFINFRLKVEALLNRDDGSDKSSKTENILVEYFQPNIAKPMHIGLLRTAVIGDALKRMLQYLGFKTESETHMGDWGTQFGFLILAYKKYGDENVIEKNPINELNKLYVRINAEAEKNEIVRDAAKQEFAKLEKGDKENRAILDKFVDWSMKNFLMINDLMDILPFDHHWPESFYEDKMPAVLEKLKKKKLLVESQGAQIVNLEGKGLGIAIVVKSDGTTTYLLRDLATFIYRKSQGFVKQLYVVDSRQKHTLAQTFAILKMMKEMNEGEAVHVDYGFISFKGSALSTRKGNIITPEEVLKEAEEKVAKLIEEKNPDLANKEEVIKAVAKAALKYFDLKHNRHSDIEFDWEQALDFEGNSGPYLQYAYARLSSILKKFQITNKKLQRNFKFSAYAQGYGGSAEGLSEGEQILNSISVTERRILFLLSIFNEKVREAMQDYLPNIFANYLYELASELNKFYHESPVMQEKDEKLKNFRLHLVQIAKGKLAKGLDLLGIKALEEM